MHRYLIFLNYDAKIRKKSDMTKRFECFLRFSAKKKESQLAPAFKKEKYNENCKTLSPDTEVSLATI